MTRPGAHGRALVVAICVALVGVATPGCSSHGASRARPASATVASHRGPGTETVAGVTVQPGSHLLGAVFPDGVSAVTGRKVDQALIAVDGELSRVFGAYVKAAEHLGYRVGPTGCRSQEVPGAITCGATGTARTGGVLSIDAITPMGGHEFSTLIRLQSSPGSPDARGAASSTTLDAAARSLVAIPPSTSTDPAAAVITAAGAETVTGGKVPTVGQLIGGQLDRVPGTGLKVLRGSTMLAPAVPWYGGSAGWTAVVRANGSPSAVRDAYLATSPELGVPPTRRTVRVGGETLLLGAWSTAGGPFLNLTVVPAGDHQAFVLLEVGND